MARIAGVNIPSHKKIEIALTYIFGIGRTTANKICEQAKIDITKRVNELSEDQIAVIREVIDQNHQVEGELRSEVSMNIKRLVDRGCDRGIRHRKRLPVRVQKTHANARTRKGKAVAIAGKKK